MSEILTSELKATGRKRVAPQPQLRELQKRAVTLRRHVVEMIAKAGSGHPGGSLSAADILAVLFFAHMRHDPANPQWPDRDRFILSKGHGAPILYAAMAEAGYFPLGQLSTFRRLGSPLQGHPSRRDLPALEASTGSLGQGISIGSGMALAAKLDRATYRVYVLVGDGESEEGQIWEAAMVAAHFKLDNLTVIVDRNGFQLDGATRDITALEPLAAKWQSFGWHVTEIDGHDMSAILGALEEANSTSGRPTVIVADTIKGKGVSFMENDNEFHGKAPSAAQTEQALKELGLG